MSTADFGIDDELRRRRGAFYTPAIWAEEANKTLDAMLWSTWRDDCLVWDCAAGTGNLTRGRQYNDLILSTLEQTEVEVLAEQRAFAFCMDFLNTPIERLPSEVQDKLKAAAQDGTRVVFFINPPYGSAANKGANSTHKAGIAATQVHAKMRELKMGHGTQQLYIQFMYQCLSILSHFGVKQYTIGIFCNPIFMTSDVYAPFLEMWEGVHGICRWLPVSSLTVC